MKYNTITVNPTYVKTICDKYGRIIESSVAIEECAELSQCVSKEIRGEHNVGHMEEEIGDVLIGISDLIYIYGLDEKKIQRWIDFKLNRQIGRIKED